MVPRRRVRIDGEKLTPREVATRVMVAAVVFVLAAAVLAVVAWAAMSAGT